MAVQLASPYPNMVMWETEDESTGPGASSLPTPAETPFRTPSRSSRSSRSRSSRRSRRSVTPPGKAGKSSFPSPLPTSVESKHSDTGSKRRSRGTSQDESLSVLDPRRFTPTLHANLVSEILTLRRDQEEKTKFIEGLEATLHSTRQECDSLQTTLSTTSKENRSLKRQLALLEGGTSSALGELARERDEAVDLATESKKRLDASQKKLRVQEEDSGRVHDQWAKEKNDWAGEQRKLERRIHITETRLKTVLDEFAAYQEAGQFHGNGHAVHDDMESERGESPCKENDGASVRTMSITNSIRFSTLTSLNRPIGHSLADELNFDVGDDDESDYGHGGRDSVLSNGHSHMRNISNMSRDSMIPRAHRRHRSSESLIRPGSVARGRLVFNNPGFDKFEDGTIREDDETPSEPAPMPVISKATYVNTGIQFSPPPSPKLAPVRPQGPDCAPAPLPARSDPEIEANQRRKRVHVSMPLTIKPVTTGSLMVSSACQTTCDEPLSPPKTPKSSVQEWPSHVNLPPPRTVSASTQTDSPPALRRPSFSTSAMLPIPTISIIPPTSRPSTPREPRLPQQFKDIGCQVSLVSSSIATASISTQTDEIRVDRRLDRLPLHLHPSTISSRPASPASPQPDDGPGQLPPRNPRRLTFKRSLSDESPSLVPTAAPDEDISVSCIPNDEGPVSNQNAQVRRPQRISSLFAGFEGGSSDEGEDLDGFSDQEYQTALAPRPKTGKRIWGGNRRSIADRPVPESPSVAPARAGNRYSRRPMPLTAGSADVEVAGGPSQDTFDDVIRGGPRRPPRTLMGSVKQNAMRKSAMIQSGIASHSRALSPTGGPEVQEPPFPIPTRASSRQPDLVTGAPSDAGSGARDDGGWDPQHPRRSGGRTHRANSIRKVRSATVIPRHHRYRRRTSRSPPPFSPSTEASESPGLPPLPGPLSEVGSYAPSSRATNPRRDSYNRSYKTHRNQGSVNTTTTGETGGAGSSSGPSTKQSQNQTTSVVDAIAQTMVGEWMFKYVRRRKSFGVADSKVGDESSNDRHRRWVWLAPYERAILWSSKQPSSGSALMGKPGRKLTIQSVLDVKDDNPPPKNGGPVFNRSILILTPQRALKFTATTPERHYIWLTSLSFLAHSQQAIPQNIAAPPPQVVVKPLPEQYDLPRPKPRRQVIRDSIRLTKTRMPGISSGLRSPPLKVSAESGFATAPTRIPEELEEHIQQLPDLPAFHARDVSSDAAEPPAIPRFQERANQVLVHGRKRSNTGGHVPPPLSFRGFSGPGCQTPGSNSNNPSSSPSAHQHLYQGSTAGASVAGSASVTGSSDVYSSYGISGHHAPGSSAMSTTTGTGTIGWGVGSGIGPPSIRTSEASSRPSGAVMNNFFDAIGTMRMEAFISPLAFSRSDDVSSPPPSDIYLPHEDSSSHHGRSHYHGVRRRSKEIRRWTSRSQHRDSYQSRGTRTTDDLDDWYVKDDPFKGF